MRTREDQLESCYRRLLSLYPKAWRAQHEDAVIGVLLDEADAAGRSTLTTATALDLIGHAAEERLESLMRWMPARLRARVAMTALVAAAGLSVIMLLGEVLGAHGRPPAELIYMYGEYFISGPFMTIGVGLYIAFLIVFVLVVRGHGGFARFLLLGAVALAAITRALQVLGGYPAPRLMVLAMFAGLGLLAALATIRPSRQEVRRILGFGAGFTGALVLGLATAGIYHYGGGVDLASFGNSGLGSLAGVLTVLMGIALVVSLRHPGWTATIAVAAFPLVVFCSIASWVAGNYDPEMVAAYPLGYLLVASSVALIYRQGQRSGQAVR